MCASAILAQDAIDRYNKTARLDDIPSINRSLSAPDASPQLRRVTIEWLKCYLDKDEPKAVAALSEFWGSFTASGAASVGVSGYANSKVQAGSDGASDSLNELLEVLVSLSVLRRVQPPNGGGSAEGARFSMHPLIRQLAPKLRGNEFGVDLAATATIGGVGVVSFGGLLIEVNAIGDTVGGRIIEVVEGISELTVMAMAITFLGMLGMCSLLGVMASRALITPKMTQAAADQAGMLTHMLLDPEGPGQKVALGEIGIAQSRQLLKAEEANFRQAAKLLGSVVNSGKAVLRQVFAQHEAAKRWNVWPITADLQRVVEALNGVSLGMIRAGWDANLLASTVAKLSKEGLGARHKATLAAGGVLASALRGIGEWRKARAAQAVILAQTKKVWGHQHKDTLAAMRNLAATLTGLDECAAARKLLEKALAASVKQLGPRHPDTLETMSHLADSMWHEGERDDAVKLAKQAADLQEQVVGLSNPSTLATAANLAWYRGQQGDWGGSHEMLEVVRRLQEQALGPDHPDTLATMVRLAETLVALGQVAGARVLVEEALALGEEVLTAEHPDMLAAMACLGAVLCAEGAWAEACKLQHEVLDLATAVLGPQHRSTLAAKARLAESCTRQGGRLLGL
jgi:tetratricopeptide (TPR) repeat protein